MEITMIGKFRNKFWYFVLASFLLWFLLLLYFNSSSTVDVKDEVTLIGNNFTKYLDSPVSDFPGKSDGNFDMSVVRGDNIRQQTGDSTKHVENVKDNDDHVEKPPIETDKGDNPDDDFVITDDLEEQIDQILASGKEENPGSQTVIEEKKPEVAVVKKRVKHRKRTRKVAKKQPRKENKVKPEPEVKPQPLIKVRAEPDPVLCAGRYVYIHDLPSKFNEDLIRNCRSLSNWTDMCWFISNYGLGAQVGNFEKVYSNTGWYITNQFLLEVIFHNRMRQYKCLTQNSSMAQAIFVPYYPGLDVARFLWDSNPLKKDSDSNDLVKWLREKPEWMRMWGRDHFMVVGRITWDFRRETDTQTDWGNQLMLLPESKNMTMLVIESSPWNKNDFAIPYPTYFHPLSDKEVFEWQDRMRKANRRFLFSFAGGPRPNLPNTIRGEIIDQCRASRRKCKFMECITGSSKCDNPDYVMKFFQSSVFCLQPQGDSFTRRSAFDSILAGCIPVFFHPGSAYVQYLWHLPMDYTKYSVFIPAKEVKDKKASIQRILEKIPQDKVLAMREEVIRLIPRVIYADPRSELESLEDAFDVTMKGVLERVEKIREEIREGKIVDDFDEEFTWKHEFFGTDEPHEWDPMFARA